jgi:putative transposase
VFSTKYRRKILKSGLGEYMKVLIKTIERRHPEIKVFEVNTDEDHVHLLASIAPKMALSRAVTIIKTNTARMMSQRFPFLKKVYLGMKDSIWSPGYFVSTVGLDEKTIRRYIELQGQEDSGQARLEL